MPRQQGTVQALRIGALARAVLEAPPQSGDVVGRFSAGLNARFHAPKAVVAVQTESVAFHPYAVEIEEPPLAVPVGTAVHVRDDKITIGEFCVDFAAARAEPLVLEPFDRREAHLARSRLPIVSGVFESGRAVCPHDPAAERIAETVGRWRSSGDDGVLLELLGLGGGATPSGDDLLVGLAAGLTLQATVSPSAYATVTRLGPAFLAMARRCTGLASAQMIEAILDRQAPEPLCQLVAVLREANAEMEAVRRAAERVAHLGAKSGLYLLAGLLLAWEIRENRNGSENRTSGHP